MDRIDSSARRAPCRASTSQQIMLIFGGIAADYQLEYTRIRCNIDDDNATRIQEYRLSSLSRPLYRSEMQPVISVYVPFWRAMISVRA